MDATARPSDLLKIKVGDIEIKKDNKGNFYVPLVVGKYGKRKKDVQVGMTGLAIRFYREYLEHDHPDPNNSDAYVFASTEHSAKNQRPIPPISPGAIRLSYYHYRDKRIPALLRSPDTEVPPEDKKMLKHLQKTKKWFPYNTRHSSISRLKNNPNVNDYTLRQHAGWTKNSRMVERYTHDSETDSLEHVMLAYGIDITGGGGGVGGGSASLTDEEKKRQELLRQEMQPTYCHFCGMINDKDARFCNACKFPLNTEAANEQREEAAQNKKKLEDLAARQSAVEYALRRLIADEMDFDVREPDDHKALDDAFKRATTITKTTTPDDPIIGKDFFGGKSIAEIEDILRKKKEEKE